MKDFTKKSLLVSFCIIVAMLLVLMMDKQYQLENRIVQQARPQVEEPQRIQGKWQIIMYRSGIFPPKIIKTDCYYVKDKIIWYRDMATGEELPLPEGDQIIPDDGRDLEQYGVYKLDMDPMN